MFYFIFKFHLLVGLSVLGITSGNLLEERDMGFERNDDKISWLRKENDSRPKGEEEDKEGWKPRDVDVGRMHFKEQNKQRKYQRRVQRQERREKRRRNRHRGVEAQQGRHNIPIGFPEDSFSYDDEEHERDIEDHDYKGQEDQMNERDTPRFGLHDPNGISSAQPTSDRTWLENNITSIWLTLNHIERGIKKIRRQVRSNRLMAKKGGHRQTHADLDDDDDLLDDEPCDPEWDVEPNACLDEQGLICGGKGECLCGQCECSSPLYGINCQCNDMICQRHGGVLCGGAGRGQCRCGACVCREEFTGSACECSKNTNECQKDNGEICGGQGACVCNRCQCSDGYTGKFCNESIYSAGVCERLKPCVLCRAYGRQYPQCEACNIKVEIANELDSSTATCIMISSGCVFKYSYLIPTNEDEGMTVIVTKEKSCMSLNLKEEKEPTN